MSNELSEQERAVPDLLDPSDIFTNLEDTKSFTGVFTENALNYISSKKLKSIIPGEQAALAWFRSLPEEEKVKAAGGHNLGTTGKALAHAVDESITDEQRQSILNEATALGEQLGQSEYIKVARKLAKVKEAQAQYEKYIEEEGDKTFLQQAGMGSMMAGPYANPSLIMEQAKELANGESVTTKIKDSLQVQEKLADYKRQVDELNNELANARAKDRAAASQTPDATSTSDSTNSSTSGASTTTGSSDKAKPEENTSGTVKAESVTAGVTTSSGFMSGNADEFFKEYINQIAPDESTSSTGSGVAGGIDAGPLLDVSNLTSASVPDGGAGDLGTYVKKFESGPYGPSAIGKDSTGGTSFGTYQIAVRVGAFKDFIRWAATHGGEFGKEVARRFNELGERNWDTGKNGPAAELWRALAAVNGGSSLSALERKFIQSQYYDQALAKISDPDMRKMIEADRGLKEALWSTAVQHGASGAASIFKKTYQKGASAETWLKAIYQYRSTQFGKSTPKERKAVLDRYKRELPLVISLSKASPTLDVNLSDTKENGNTSYVEGDTPEAIDLNASQTDSSSFETGVTNSNGWSTPPTQASGVQLEQPKSVQDAIQLLKDNDIPNYVSLGGGGWNSVGKLNPDLLTRFATAAVDFKNTTGKSISITSAFRTHEDQIKLSKSGTTGAAKPGSSPHERGVAIDIADASGRNVKSQGYYTGTISDQFEAFAEKYGLWRPYSPKNKPPHGLSSEEQHFEVKKGGSVAADPGDTKPSTTNALTPKGDLNSDGAYSKNGGDGSGSDPLQTSPQPSIASGDPNATISVAPEHKNVTDAQAATSAAVTATTAGGAGASASDVTTPRADSASMGGESSSTEGGSMTTSTRSASSTMVQSTSPVTELEPTSVPEDDLGLLPEVKSQTQHLIKLTELISELLGIAKNMETKSSGQGAVAAGSAMLGTTNLSSLFDAYLGAKSPLLQALSGGEDTNTNSTPSRSAMATPPNYGAPSANFPIDVRKIFS